MLKYKASYQIDDHSLVFEWSGIPIYTHEWIVGEIENVGETAPQGGWSNRFEILHRARQWYCRTLGKISKQFDKQY